ncbi:MAG TPA: radical SAM protein [Rectinemataceae bacterium]|nr:radical SAM protein [Rectinemataceae bacterium]
MNPPVDLLGLAFADLETEAAARLPGGRGIAGKVYARAFESGRLDLDGLGLTERNRRAWEENFGVGLLTAGRRASEEGEFGPTEKTVLVLADGEEVECVLIPMPPKPDGKPRSTLCVSSQVGCRMGCAFCETGRGGLARNLGAAEIVSQLVTTKTLFGWNPGNIVFMGMGEPLDNPGGLLGALAVLTDSRGLAFSWDRITVCTSGKIEGLEALREASSPRLNLSLSLNGADDVTRNRIMPINRSAGIDALATALAGWPRRRNFVLALNWCLLPGINDRPEDARRAADFAKRVGRSVFNLIPYNPGRKPIAPAPTEEEVEDFAALLEAAGCIVKRRAKKGGRIMAACGQLGGPTASRE